MKKSMKTLGVLTSVLLLTIVAQADTVEMNALVVRSVKESKSPDQSKLTISVARAEYDSDNNVVDYVNKMDVTILYTATELKDSALNAKLSNCRDAAEKTMANKNSATFGFSASSTHAVDNTTFQLSEDGFSCETLADAPPAPTHGTGGDYNCTCVQPSNVAVESGSCSFVAMIQVGAAYKCTDNLRGSICLDNDHETARWNCSKSN